MSPKSYKNNIRLFLHQPFWRSRELHLLWIWSLRLNNLCHWRTEIFSCLILSRTIRARWHINLHRTHDFVIFHQLQGNSVCLSLYLAAQSWQWSQHSFLRPLENLYASRTEIQWAGGTMAENESLGLQLGVLYHLWVFRMLSQLTFYCFTDLYPSFSYYLLTEFAFRTVR